MLHRNPMERPVSDLPHTADEVAAARALVANPHLYLRWHDPEEWADLTATSWAVLRADRAARRDRALRAALRGATPGDAA